MADWTVVYEPPLLATCRHPEGGLVRLAASASDALLRSKASTFIVADACETSSIYITALWFQRD